MSTTNENQATMDQQVDDLLDAVEEVMETEADDTDPVESVEDQEEEQASDSEKQLEVANVLPLHAATAKKLDMRPGAVLKRREEEAKKRGRGRPRKVTSKPTTDDLLYHQQMQEAEVEFIDSDAIVSATNNRKDSPELLHLVKSRVARAAAALEFQRIEQQKYGKDTGQITSRQIAALREIAQIELKIRELGPQMLDLRSEPVQKLFGMFITKLRDSAREILPKQQFDLLFNKLETDLDGWEDEAEALLR